MLLSFRPLICLLAAGVQLHSATGWNKTTSPYIELYTTASPKEAAALFQHLDAIRQLFERTEAICAARIRVVVFRNTKEYEPWAASPGVAAFHRGDLHGDIVAIGNPATPSWAPAVHEYVHVLAQRAGLKGPAWLVEGLADVLANVRITAGQASASGVPASLAQAVKKPQWLPYAKLSAANQAHDPDVAKSRAYRAQSWLLVHMLMRSPGYRERFPEFVRLATSTDPLLRVYGKTAAEVEKDLARYARGKITDPSGGAKVQPAASVTSTVDKLEIGLVLARLASLLHREEDAGQRLAALATEFPENCEVAEGRAYLAWRAGDHDGARQLLEMALRKGAKNWATHYDYARLLQGVAGSQETMLNALKRAVELNPASDEARLMLGFESYRAVRYVEAAKALSGLKELSPERSALVLMILAYSHLQSGNRDEARRIANDALKAARMPAEQAQAQKLLQHIDYDAPEAPVEAGNGGEALRITGALQKVDCLEKSVRLRVVAASRPFHLVIRETDRVNIQNSTGEKSASLACGLRKDVPVTVVYVPRLDAQLKTIGEVSSLVFSK